jgi:signal transduction histidine kinase
VLQLSSGGRDFRALLPLTESLPAGLRAGSTLDLTGLCYLELSDDRRRIGRGPDGFSLHLRTAADIQVIAAGPWWTSQRLWLAFGTAALVAGMAAVWAITLQAKNKRLHAALAAQARAEEELATERRRVANQLHDTLQQTLVAASLQLHAASRSAANAPMQLALELLQRGQEEVRDAVWDLRMDEQARVNLGELLSGLASEMSRRSVMEIRYSEDAPCIIPAHVVSQLVRIVREALTNAMKHAEAESLSIQLTHSEQGLALSISDDGRGFDANACPGQDQGHFGLGSMAERAAALGGQLRITSNPGRGTEICVLLPLTA